MWPIFSTHSKAWRLFDVAIFSIPRLEYVHHHKGVALGLQWTWISILWNNICLPLASTSPDMCLFLTYHNLLSQPRDPSVLELLHKCIALYSKNIKATGFGHFSDFVFWWGFEYTCELIKVFFFTLTNQNLY
jgi:hypothetical protein